MKTFTYTLFVTLLTISPASWSAVFDFDTVDSYHFGEYVGSGFREGILTGSQKNTGEPITLSLRLYMNETVYQVCNTYILMAIDKPGKYFVTIYTQSSDPASLQQSLRSCRIEYRR